MSFRGILALVLLLAATGAERLSYYGARSFLAFEMYRSEGMTVAAAGTALTAMSFVMLVATFAGAGLALGMGPRLTAAVGALIAALGPFLLAFDAPVLLGFGLTSAGAGIFRVGPFVAAAEVLGTTAAPDARSSAPHPQRFVAMTAFAAAASVAANLGSFLAAPIAGSLLYERGGRVAATVGTGAVAVVAAVLAGAAALLGMLELRDRPMAPPRDPYREAAPPTSVSPDAKPSMLPLAGAAVLAVLLGVFDVGLAMAGPAPSVDVSSKDYAWLYGMSSAVALIGCMITAGAFLIGALVQTSLPPLPVFGAGLALAGVGFFVQAVGGEEIALLGAGMAMTALGDAVLPIAIAYVALAVRGRVSGLVLAGWFCVASVASMIGAPLGHTPLRTPLLAVIALACLIAGAATAVLGRTFHRAWFDPQTR